MDSGSAVRYDAAIGREAIAEWYRRRPWHRKGAYFHGNHSGDQPKRRAQAGERRREAAGESRT